MSGAKNGMTRGCRRFGCLEVKQEPTRYLSRSWIVARWQSRSRSANTTARTKPRVRLLPSQRVRPIIKRGVRFAAGPPSL